MGKLIQNMHFSNIDGIQSYSLFGESQHLPDVLHCETIAARSVLHDWELAPHRHTRLHQVLLVQSGGGVAHLDGEKHALFPGALINVPAGHVHAFRFTQHASHPQPSCPAKAGHPVNGGVSAMPVPAWLLGRPPSRAMTAEQHGRCVLTASSPAPNRCPRAARAPWRRPPL